MRRANEGPSSIGLPCIRCGREASQGRRVTLELKEHSTGSYVGFLFGIVPGLLLRDATAKPAGHFSYSLCPRCLKMRRVKQVIAGIAWVCFFVSVFILGVAENWEMWAGIAFWMFFVAVFATALSSVKLVSEKKFYRPGL
jgi:hypothetical protein